MIQVHIGLDDIDSIYGGCTTHYATILSWRLLREGFIFIDYPNLIRLNPSIPWKTRGNGAVALRLLLESIDEIDDLRSIVLETFEEYVRELRDPKHQPSVVIHVGDVPLDYKWLAEKALHDLVPLDLAERLTSKYKDKTSVYTPRGKRGVIGALAAIGNLMLDSDHTYELIAYRTRENWGSTRRVDLESIIEMDKRFGDKMILNYDYGSNRPLIMPHGPDPVLLGLRGEDPFTLLEAFKTLRIHEPVEYISLFRTNQHTDPHIKRVESISEVKPYMCVSLRAVVAVKPIRARGGHVFFKVCDNTGCIDIAVYEPSKVLRDVAMMLEPGDTIIVYGCTRPPSSRHGLTINTEKLEIVELVDVYREENPKCPICGARMESMGRNKGFRCRRCRYKSRELYKIKVQIKREIKPGIYQPPPSSFKHVMKPVERIGREKRIFNGIEVKEFVVKLL